MTVKEFQTILEDESELPPQFFLNILIRHLLGDKWYSIYNRQVDVNADAVCEILKRYPRRRGFFRKLFCFHDYDCEYLHKVDGGMAKLYRCTCKKCGKVSYKTL